SLPTARTVRAVEKAGQADSLLRCERTNNNNKTSPGGTSMTMTRLPALTASAIVLLSGRPSSAAELIYGSWTPAQEYQNRVAMPELFRNIEKDTGGAIKWKLIAGGQIAD